MKLRYFLMMLALVASAAVQAQNVDEILSKYFETTGGIDKWRNLKSVTMSGKAFMMGQEFPFTRYGAAPNKQKTVINIQGTELIFGAYDGTTAWMLNPLGGGKDPVKMDEESSKDIKDEMFEDDFIDYKKKGHEVALEGTEEVDGVKCFKVRLTKNKFNDKEDITKYYYFDTENYIPIVVSDFARSGPQKGMEQKTYLSDYQEVGGLIFPFSMESKVNGQSGSKMKIEKIEVNNITDESIFAFPKK